MIHNSRLALTPCSSLTTKVLTQQIAEIFCASFHFKCSPGLRHNATDLPRGRARVGIPSANNLSFNSHLLIFKWWAPLSMQLLKQGANLTIRLFKWRAPLSRQLLKRGANLTIRLFKWRAPLSRQLLKHFSLHIFRPCHSSCGSAPK